jgi:16S rRNA (guanine1516-N2)-methyltransferase
VNAASGPGGAIGLACLDAGSASRAAALAQALGIDNVALPGAGWRQHTEHAYLVLVSTEGLALGMTGATRVAPVRGDFADPKLLYRMRGPGARREDLARATGARERRGLRLIDATAGWGRDSAVLAALGCDVTMIERHPVVAALLADALARARLDASDRVRQLATRLLMIAGDARELLPAWRDPPPDVVLLDPMFPERGASAAVRKEMRFFQDIVGGDDDAPLLLEAALALAVHRVVVKRPRKAPALAGRTPSYAIEGRSTRFDVYALRGFG